MQIKARFDGDRDTFEFLCLLGMPTQEPPNYLTARKEDKLEAAKLNLAAKKNVRFAGRRSATLSPMPVPKTAVPKPIRRKIGSKNV